MSDMASQASYLAQLNDLQAPQNAPRDAARVLSTPVSSPARPGTARPTGREGPASPPGGRPSSSAQAQQPKAMVFVIAVSAQTDGLGLVEPVKRGADAKSAIENICDRGHVATRESVLYVYQPALRDWAARGAGCCLSTPGVDHKVVRACQL